jgi:hypothetical protein
MRPTSQGGRGWSDIAYSHGIRGGVVMEGRGWGVVGGHTKDHNSTSHAICVVGNFELVHPTDQELETVAQFVAHGVLAGKSPYITGPHRDARLRDGSLPGTQCAGRHLIARIPEINARAREIVNQVVNPPKEVSLMAYTRAQAEELVRSHYRTFAGREVDTGGLQHWAPLVQNGNVTPDRLALVLLEAEGLPRLRSEIAAARQSGPAVNTTVIANEVVKLIKERL